MNSLFCRNRHIFYENKLIEELNVTENIYQDVYNSFMYNKTVGKSLNISECSLANQLDNVSFIIFCQIYVFFCTTDFFPFFANIGSRGNWIGIYRFYASNC